MLESLIKSFEEINNELVGLKQFIFQYGVWTKGEKLDKFLKYCSLMTDKLLKKYEQGEAKAILITTLGKASYEEVQKLDDLQRIMKSNLVEIRDEVIRYNELYNMNNEEKGKIDDFINSVNQGEK